MKNSKATILLFVIFLLSISHVQAQSKTFFANDNRVKRFEKEMILFLHNQKEHIEIKYPFNIIDYKNIIVVNKHLEINTANEGNLLLIRFSINADHCGRYWGVLSNTKFFFFNDIDDTSEPDLLGLKKTCDDYVYETIIFYCFKNSPSRFIGDLPIAEYIFKKELFEIKQAIHTGNHVHSQTDSAISFLQRLTGISPTVSEINVGCSYFLTSQDYTNWLNWYRKNHSKLFWDSVDIKSISELNQLDKVKVAN